MRRLPLGSLRVFVAVAEHLNFTRAADALGVTPSAASLQIRTLEHYLSRPLFRRNGRQVHLTQEGCALLPRVQQAMRDIERAIDDVRGESAVTPIKVTTLSSFLQQWLLPRINRFRQAHPNVELHLQSSPDVVDFVREDFHMAIRFGMGGWPNLRAEKLFDEWLLPVCAPGLYKKGGAVRGMDDLRRYPLLHSMSEPWTAWLLEGRADGPNSGFRGALFEDSLAVVRMALQGDGLALARWSLVADDVARGALVAVSERSVRFDRSYWVVWPNRSDSIAAVKSLTSWLHAEAGAFSGPPAAGLS